MNTKQQLDGAPASRAALRGAYLPLVLGAAAVAVALLGQWLLDRREQLGPLVGGAGLILGAILFVVADRRLGSPAPGEETALPEPVTAPGAHANRAPVLLTGLALLVMALAVPGFVLLAHAHGQAPDAGAANIPWLLWMAAVALLVAAAWLGAGRPAGGVRAWAAWRPGASGLALAAVLLIAAVLRFYDLAQIPRGFWIDEAIAGQIAKHLAADPAFRPIYLGEGNGEPAFYYYLLAAMEWLLGPTVLAIRWLMAAAGLAGVAALFWFARPLYGPRVALIGAAVLASMTWHLTFSRIAFNAGWSIPVDLLAAGCLFRGLAGGRRGWYILAGLLFGLGFHLYYISRAWLLLIGLVVAWRLIAERGLLRQVCRGLLLTGIGLLVAAAPVLTYAAVEPADYLARAGSVSVFSAVGAVGSVEPLVRSLSRHLGMFNVAGDANGRHNLPGARMLDLVTAALLPIGVALAAVWARRGRRHGPDARAGWPYGLLVAALVVLLAGGVLSNPDESPQALRTLGVVVPVALLAALPIVRLWTAADQALAAWQPATRLRGVTPGPVLALVLCAVLTGANVHRYFDVQQPHPLVWDRYSTALTLIAEEVARHQADADIYVA
ncbi:MAG TPA: glycosyltransferase family 39 protein, partial [Chloroflexia bacterium]|nr:glycosyltransferase family 39 protein [Chloroflexia bacterium]